MKIHTVYGASREMLGEAIAEATGEANAWIAEAKRHRVRVRSVRAQTFQANNLYFHVITMIAKPPKNTLTLQYDQAIAFLEGRE